MATSRSRPKSTQRFQRRSLQSLTPTPSLEKSIPLHHFLHNNRQGEHSLAHTFQHRGPSSLSSSIVTLEITEVIHTCTSKSFLDKCLEAIQDEKALSHVHGE